MKNRSAGRNHRDKYLISDILSRNRDDVIDFSRSFFIHTWYEYLSENLNKTEIRNLEKNVTFPIYRSKIHFRKYKSAWNCIKAEWRKNSTINENLIQIIFITVKNYIFVLILILFLFPWYNFFISRSTIYLLLWKTRALQAWSTLFLSSYDIGGRR